MNILYLLDVPFSGADVFLHHCESYSQGRVKRYRDTLEAPDMQGVVAVSSISLKLNPQLSDLQDLKRFGIMLREPALRLAYAYRAVKKRSNTNQTFEQFYTDPARRNLYSQLLGNRSLKKLGFIGVLERFNISLSNVEEWFSLNTKLHRFDDLQPHNSELDRLLTPDHRRSINRCHAQDYQLYQQALAEVEIRFRQRYPITQRQLPPEKRVVIHVGPGKTGTSAIQKWLLEHAKLLRDNGIYYPIHDTDANGVSSGNFKSLLSLNTNTQQYDIAPAKIEQLLSRFESSAQHTLLLSSEYFHNLLFELQRFFPDAKYVFYIRHPLSLIESLYHQSVKRHHRTEPFTIPNTLGFNRLMMFLRDCTELGVTPTLRLYDKGFHEGNNLIEDFCRLLGLTDIAVKLDSRVNPSLGFEELEFMRFCNSFADTESLARLDLWLQQKSQLKSAFTLMTADQVKQAQYSLNQQIECLIPKFGHVLQNPELIDKLHQLVEVRDGIPQKTQSDQYPSGQLVWQELKATDIYLAAKLHRQFRSQLVKDENASGPAYVQLDWQMVDHFRFAALGWLHWLKPKVAGYRLFSSVSR